MACLTFHACLSHLVFPGCVSLRHPSGRDRFFSSACSGSLCFCCGASCALDDHLWASFQHFLSPCVVVSRTWSLCACRSPVLDYVILYSFRNAYACLALSPVLSLVLCSPFLYPFLYAAPSPFPSPVPSPAYRFCLSPCFDLECDLFPSVTDLCTVPCSWTFSVGSLTSSSFHAPSARLLSA